MSDSDTIVCMKGLAMQTRISPDFFDRCQLLAIESSERGDPKQANIALMVLRKQMMLWDAKTNAPIDCPEEPGALVDYLDAMLRSIEARDDDGPEPGAHCPFSAGRAASQRSQCWST
jgi:hypothetical protein